MATVVRRIRAAATKPSSPLSRGGWAGWLPALLLACVVCAVFRAAWEFAFLSLAVWPGWAAIVIQGFVLGALLAGVSVCLHPLQHGVWASLAYFSVLGPYAPAFFGAFAATSKLWRTSRERISPHSLYRAVGAGTEAFAINIPARLASLAALRPFDAKASGLRGRQYQTSLLRAVVVAFVLAWMRNAWPYAWLW